ncbi:MULTISPECIES: hypothetical protein [Streptomyces]|uniref:Uncharacterized protein n=1 Tax=Streptomyces dengpaensis TaxID=2049881 RepID=A0ABM6SUL0_9ACTN|nr:MULTISPECIES: hypothetical protein [Streptomyces]AVH58417.1 hypothetical protein C4B68_24560 [Streptomyces dengpaensis]PIB06090.1 hypothetical protein B1C81_26280 [Streptomyces sp. HG99]
MRRTTAVLATGTAALALIIGIVIQLTARAASPGNYTYASDVGLAVTLLATLALAILAPHALHVGYHWAHDRGVTTRRRFAQHDAALARGDTAPDHTSSAAGVVRIDRAAK